MIGATMSEVSHEDLHKLHQYHILLHHELKKIEEKNPAFRNGSNISRLVRKVVEASTRIADERIIGGAQVSEPVSKDSIIWLLFANMLLLIGMTVFIVNMHNSILDLESKVFPTGRMFTEEVK